MTYIVSGGALHSIHSLTFYSGLCDEVGMVWGLHVPQIAAAAQVSTRLPFPHPLHCLRSVVGDRLLAGICGSPLVMGDLTKRQTIRLKSIYHN